MSDPKNLKRKVPDGDGTVPSGPVSELYLKDQETEKWLVKVPAFMYEAWQGITTDTVVGVVDVVPEGGAVKLKFNLDDTTLDYGGAPLEYELIDTSQSQPRPKPQGAAVVFVEDAFTGKMQLDGKIEKFVDLDAVDKVALSKFALKRTKAVTEGAKKQHQSVKIEGVRVFETASGSFTNNLTKVQKATDQFGKQEKNFRVSEQELELRIMEAYAERDEYTFKELNEILKQPEVYLKEQLPKYCTQVKREQGQGFKWVLNSDLRSIRDANKRLKTQAEQTPGSAPKGPGSQ